MGAQDVPGVAGHLVEHAVQGQGGGDGEGGVGQLAQLEGLLHVALVEAGGQQLSLPLQLGRLLVEVDEHLNLGPQQPALVGLGDVVDGAGREPLQDVALVPAYGGEEDDGDVPGLVALLDLDGGLEAVHARHQDVEKDDGEVLGEEALQRLLPRRGRDQVVAEGPEHGLEGDQVLRSVVDQQDLDRPPPSVLRCGHGLLSSRRRRQAG